MITEENQTIVECPTPIVTRLADLVDENGEIAEQAQLYHADLRSAFRTSDDLLDTCYRVALWAEKNAEYGITDEIVTFILDENPEYYPAYLIRAALSERQEKLGKAYKDLKTFLNFNATDHTLVEKAADFALQLGKVRDAWQLINHLIEMRPDNIQAIAKLGKVCLALKRYKQAEKLLALATKRLTDDVDTLVNYGDALAHNAKHREAVEAYQAARVFDSENLNILNKLSSSYIEIGLYEKAFAASELALSLDDSDLLALYHCALIHEITGSQDKASVYHKRLERLKQKASNPA